MAMINNSHISFKGSLRIDCNDPVRLQEIRSLHGKSLCKANEILYDHHCDDVLVLKPQEDSNDTFTVYSDRDKKNKQELTLGRNIKNNTSRLVSGFRTLQSGERDSYPPEKGDVVAFSDYIRTAVKPVTGYNISHIAIMRDDESMLDAYPPKVKTVGFYDRLASNSIRSRAKNKSVYILRLNEESRKKLQENEADFDYSINKHAKKPYGIRKLFGFISSLFTKHSKKDIICSELVVDSLKAAQILPPGVEYTHFKKPHTSEISPGEVAEAGIYHNIFERVTKVR